MARVRPSFYGSVASYTLVGLGLVGIDFGTSWVDLFYRRQKPDQQQLFAEYDIQQPLNTNYFRNFCYGFTAANFNQIFHIKINQYLTKTNRSFTYKIIFSPFAAIPYYFIAGLFKRTPSEQIVEKLIEDLQILIPFRIAIDFLRLNDFFVKRAVLPESQAKQNKGLFLLFLACKFLNSVVLISVHDKKIFFNRE